MHRMLRRYLRLSLLSVLLSASVPGSLAGADAGGADSIRVRLLQQNQPTSVFVRSDAGGMSLFPGDSASPIAELSPGEQAHLRVRGSDVHVSFGNRSFFARSVRLVPEGNGFLHVSMRDDGDGRQYAGKIDVVPDPEARGTLKLVNHVALDTYVASVVAREYGFEDLEGAKAMAVLARTYALRVLNHRGPDYEHVDHVLAQRYDGAGRLTETALEATRQTRGEVLTYGGDLIQAVYFASSGGHTADNEDVWKSEPLPYLRGKRDPYDGASPYTRWTARIPRDRWLDILSDEYDLPVNGFLIGDRSADGRVATIDLLQNNRPVRTIRANDFRLLANRHFGSNRIKSTFFDARREGGEYVFSGKGFGHGVGLSQWGAREMSRRGHTYREILDFYYTGVTLDHLDDAPLAAQQPAPLLDDLEPDEGVPPPQDDRPEEEPTERPTTRRIGW